MSEPPAFPEPQKPRNSLGRIPHPGGSASVVWGVAGLSVALSLLAFFKTDPAGPVGAYWLALIVATLHLLAWRTNHKQLAVLSCTLSVLLAIWSCVIVIKTQEVTWDNHASDRYLDSAIPFLNHSFAICVLSVILTLVPAYFLNTRFKFGSSVANLVPFMKDLLLFSGITALLVFAPIRDSYSNFGTAHNDIIDSCIAVTATCFLLLLVLIIGKLSFFKELIIYSLVAAPIVTLVHLMGLMLYGNPFAPKGHLLPLLTILLSIVSVFSACVYIARRMKKFPNWMNHYLGSAFSLSIAVLAIALSHELALRYCLRFTSNNALFSVFPYWLLIVNIAFFAYSLVFQTWHSVVLSSGIWMITMLYMIIELPFYGLYASADRPHNYISIASFPLYGVSLALLMLAWYVSKCTFCREQAGLTANSILTYLLLSGGAFMFTYSFRMEQFYWWPCFYNGYYASWRYIALCSVGTTLYIIAIAIGRLCNFKELLTILVFLAPVFMLGVFTMHFSSNDPGTQFVIPLFFLVFMYLLWLLMGERQSGRLARAMLVYTEISICLLALLATPAQVGLMPKFDWFFDPWWYPWHPMMGLSWALLAVVAFGAWRVSNRFVYRVATLLFVTIALAVQIGYLARIACDGLSNLSAFQCVVFFASLVGLLLLCVWVFARFRPMLLTRMHPEQPPQPPDPREKP